LAVQDKTKRVAQVILHAVGTVQVGKHKLACFLKGSKSKEVIPVAHQDVFGGLFWYDIPTIEGFIEQLEAIGLIEKKVVQGYPPQFSVYAVTAAGKKVTEENIEIPLQVIKKDAPLTAGESEKQTLKMLRQGKTTSEIAKERSLAESTIYTHFCRLIANNLLESSEVVTKEAHDAIKEVCIGFGKQPSLKEIKELLPPEITYDQIRCVTAGIFMRKDGS
jgi:DNA-binding PadR family transcriptional regulator